MVNLIWLPLSTAQVETSRCPGYEDVSNARMQRVVDISSLQIGANVDAGACGMVCNTGQIYCLPTGIIIGEYKTGTAEIRLWFKSHPHVHMASGEPSNLATDPVVKFRKYMKQTPGWRPFTPKEIRSGVIAMEKSPIYSTEYCASSRKMKTLLPSIKLILSVRDPARRAYSAFMQQCRMFLLVETHQGEVVRCDKPGSLHPNANCRALQGDRTQIFRQLGPRACNAGAFDKYLKGVKRRQSEAGITLDELYKRMDTSFNNSVCVQADRYMQEELLAHGLYSATIQAYWRHFQQMQLKVVFMGDFKKDALSFIKQVEDHVGIPHHRFLVHKSNGFWVLNSRSEQSKATTQSQYEDASNEAREYLCNFYKPEVRRLVELLPEHTKKFQGWDLYCPS